MAFIWTKDWSASDDGTIVDGADLGNIQSDIDSQAENTTAIYGYTIIEPTAGNDNQFFYWDNDNSQFTYKDLTDPSGPIGTSAAYAGSFTVLSASTSLALATGATVTGIADEDDMASDSATLICTQQSIKKYVDDRPKNTASCFSVTMDADQTITGSETLEFDTENFDLGSDFNTGTYTFTAPTTGYYLFTCTVKVIWDDGPGLDTYTQVNLVTTGGSHTLHREIFEAGGSNPTTDKIFGGSIIVAMTATDTAHISFSEASGSTISVDDATTIFTGMILSN